jgi:Bacterial membrane protein YfhO
MARFSGSADWDTGQLARLRSVLAVVVMLLLTEAVYLRPETLRGTSSLMGSDYEMLHRWRLAFARQALGAGQGLPGWNPHEGLGAPFAANLQSFPWIPTRLVLLLFDPSVAYAVGIAMAAALAALFTYLYCRRAGLTEVGAATAGWTFACAGYFSSRVMAGHLPLLEAYPALPLLLWMVDRARHRFDLAALALCCTCVVAAGHPQVPAYALGSALLYALWCGRVRVAGAMVLGIAMAMAVWWPMLKLIGRSTRVLHLAAPDNDVVMPYSRLLALIVPGIHGWAGPVDLADKQPFTGFPNASYFWDTASYIGILPLVAIAGLLMFCIVKKRKPEWRFRFLIWLSVGALVCSLPVATPLLHLLPGTFLRSPARMLYMSTFGAAVALGAGVDAVRRVRLGTAIVAVLLVLHFADLCRFDHWFIQTYPRDDGTLEFQTILDRETGTGRIAEERDDMVFSDGFRYDDAGGFDSVFLARFNRGYVALSGEPADTNEQVFDASELPVKGLEALGVRFVITGDERSDLQLAGTEEDTKLYRVSNPAPRTDFFAAGRAEFASEQEIPAKFAAGSWNRLLLEPEARKYVSAGQNAEGAARVEYSRPSSDVIEVAANSAAPGFVHVLESFDPGWTATVDGATAPVLAANGFEMAVPVGSGSHAVRLRYETPGRMTGIWLSLVSLLMLAGLIISVNGSEE